MKFRISMDLDQMKWILSKEDCPADLKKQLELATFKASNGFVQPAYELKPKTVKEVPLEDRYKMACKIMEAGKPLPEELKAAYEEFRYLNDLMSDEESAAYEANQIGL